MGTLDSFTVLDFETTGLDPQVDKPVEVGLVYVEGGKIVESVEQLIDPEVKIPPMASATHHLTKADVEGCPPFDHVRKVLGLDEIGPLVAHNTRFDAAFLGHDPSTWIDTLRLSKHLWPDAECHKLQYLRFYLNLDVDDHGIMPHRALGDALVTAALAQQIFSELEDDPYVLQEQPVRETICRFGNKYRNWYWRDVPDSYLQWFRKNVKDAGPDVHYTVECEMEERGL
jgi:DNA polymerase III epsilon subunit-like protein